MKLSDRQRAGFNLNAARLEHQRRTGTTPAGRWLWTPVEDAILLDLYPDYSALVSSLPGRTRKAIERRADKLRISTPRRIWSAEEFLRMAAPYRQGAPLSAILPLLCEKTVDQVYRKAGKCRIKRPKRRPRHTGLTIVDSIRQRAFDLNFTMRELDEETGKTCYFQNPTSLRWDRIARAIECLGGRPVIHFSER